MFKITKIVLTGGPCAGKTSSLPKIREELVKLGLQVFVLPEVATLLHSSGVPFFKYVNGQRVFLNEDETIDLNVGIIKIMMALEDAHEEMAIKSGLDTVILCDRGTFDPRAFCDQGTWDKILSRLNTNETVLRDQRYHAIIHLVSTAVNSPDNYTLGNNAARTESIAQAIDQDYNLQKAWTGHPHLRVIDNEGTFDQKVNKAISAVLSVVGVPVHYEVERKFLVSEYCLSDVHFKVSFIEQYYLATSDPNVSSRVRARGDSKDGPRVYTLTTKQKDDSNKTIETERFITEREFNNYVQNHLKVSDSGVEASILKKRYSFIWDGQYYELDSFMGGHEGIIILELETDNLYKELTIPPFIKVIKEVTNNPMYSNANLAWYKN